MAFKVVWSESAVDDLQQIVQFVAHENRDAAATLATRILDHVEGLSTLPRVGRMVPEKSDTSIREVMLRPYRIIYHIDETTTAIHVLRIWHSARGVPEIG